jgi:hypothetical protein
MKKSFLVCAIGLALALSVGARASADTVTIGAPAPSPTSSGTCNSCAVMQLTSNAASPTYVVPPAPAGSSWTITSWTSRGGVADASAAIEVWRPTGTTDEFRLITIGPAQPFPTNTLASHAVSIPVLPGDRLGIDSGTTNYDADYGGVTGDSTVLTIGTPTQGQTMGGAGSDFPPASLINYGSSRLNAAATLTSTSPAATPPAPVETVKKKCRKKKHTRSAQSAKKKCKKKRKHLH